MAKRKLPKTVVRSRIVKTVFWIIGLYLILGVTVLMVRPDRGDVVVQADVQEEVIHNPAMDIGVETFALNFSQHYFKWGSETKDIEDRANRLKPYLAPGVDVQAGLHGFDSQSVLSKSQIWKIEDLGQGKAKVTLRAQYAVATESDKVTRINYITIPIASDGQNFVVYDIPYFIPEPKPVELALNEKKIDTSNVLHDSALETEIVDFLDSFFKVYASGKQEEISYYTKDDTYVAGLEGILTYVKIPYSIIYTNRESENIYQVEVDVDFEDLDGATQFAYPFFLEVQKEKSRWLVVSFAQNK